MSADGSDAAPSPTSLLAIIRGRSVVVVLTAGTLLVCVLLAALFLIGGLHERDVVSSDAERAAVNLAQSLAVQVSDTLEATNCALFGLAERAAGGPAAGGPIRDWMAMQVMMVPRLHELLVIDARARVAATSGSGPPQAPDGVLDALARYHRAKASDELHVSGPLLARDGKTWLILASRRIGTADGRFVGVAAAELQESYFEGLYASVDVGPRGTIALVTDNGLVAARKPSAFIGSRIREAMVDTGGRSSGAIFLRSTLDGVNRLAAFKHLADYPLMVWVGVAPDDFLAGWYRSARSYAIAVAAIFALTGLLATSLAKQIGKRRHAEEALARLALLDGLTGLANRRRFDETLERELRRAIRDRSTTALLMIDVDHFKAYNDRYGHLGGDETLIMVAQTIAANVVRAADLAARFGGEEFAVILPATTASAAFTIAERIRAAVAARAIPHAGSPEYGIVTVSIGAASLTPTAAIEALTLVRNADEALYTSKSRGRNRSSLFAAGSRSVHCDETASPAAGKLDGNPAVISPICRPEA